VLHGIALRIPAGSFHGIVGHTGSGKTTLLSLLLRFYAAPGHVHIDGVPLEAIAEDSFRASVGMVPQEPFLLAASARENIAHGPAAHRRAGGSRGTRGACARIHRGAGTGLRHAAGRRRRAAVGGPEAAARDRAGAGGRAAHPVPRRGHGAHRFGDRAAGAAHAGAAARTRDGRRDRAPSVHRARRRPHRRAEPRPRRGTRHACGADGAGGRIYQRLYQLQQLEEEDEAQQ
jgi:ATP-binding cassette subfamily B protein/ATP-binding cassette subfamily C protein/ATP-binding cassette subfamily B multidrug efflux pump